MKLMDMVQSEQILNTVLHQKMSPKAAYAIGKNLVKMEPDIKGYELARQAILEKYGVFNKELSRFEFYKKDENGAVMKDAEDKPIPDQDAMDKMNAEHKDLVEMEIEFTPYKIPLAVLDDPAHPIGFTPAELIALDWMLIGE